MSRSSVEFLNRLKMLEGHRPFSIISIFCHHVSVGIIIIPPYANNVNCAILLVKTKEKA